MTQVKYRNLSKIFLEKTKEYKEGNEYNYSYDYFYDWSLVDPENNLKVCVSVRRAEKEGKPELKQKHIRNMFGEVDIKFYKQLFKQNSGLFHQISDLDPIIRSEVIGMKTKILLQKALNRVEKAQKEFLKAQEQYHLLKKKLYKY